jgi:ankyrin repeat protein
MVAARSRRGGRLRVVAIIGGLLLWLPLLQYGGAAGTKRGGKKKRTSPSQTAATTASPVDTAQAGVRVTYTDSAGQDRDLDTDLRLACNSAHLQSCAELLELRREIAALEGFDRYLRDEYGNTPLHDAARRGLVEVAELLLDEGGYNVNVENRMGDRPLHMSAASGHLGMTKVLLLDHGAYIDPHTSWGMSPLFWSASGSSHNHVQVARFLIQQGADVNAKTTANHTVLMQAAGEGCAAPHSCAP